MRASGHLIGAMMLLSLGCARPAGAQHAGGGDRLRINLSAGVQLSSIAFDTSTTRVVYLENATIDSSYKVGRGVGVDGGASVRLTGRFSVGVAVSSARSTRDGEVSAAIPHPFFFKTPRTIAGTASGLERSELVTHLQGLYTLHPTRKVDVALSAGPSFFRVQQDVVTDVSFTDTYPYDAPAFIAAASQRVTARNAVGFNIGADVGLKLSRHAGVGASVRFSKATVEMTPPNATAVVSTDAGGTLIAGGLRLWF